MNARTSNFPHQSMRLPDLHNQWIGLEQFLSQLTPDASQNPTYPPYNIERINEDAYRVVIALAGFTADKLNIELRLDGSLIVWNDGTPTDTENNITYVHRGIASRSFTLKFQLSPEIVVDNSKFVDGLLIINMHREVPESKKPRLIKIN